MGLEWSRKMECCTWGKGCNTTAYRASSRASKKEGITLVVETGNGTMVNLNYTARKLIDDLDAKDVLKVL
jgi:hypothetical protein